MTDLAADLDWDAAAEAGLMPAAGAVDRAIVDLTADERRELQRLLQEAALAFRCVSRGTAWFFG